jgi:hypothetical protein
MSFKIDDAGVSIGNPPGSSERVYCNWGQYQAFASGHMRSARLCVITHYTQLFKPD